MFEDERKSRAYYERRARKYDLANRIAAFIRGASPTKERRKAVRQLGLQPGQRVLEVSVGTGTNLPFIAEAGGRVVGLDISRGMLGVCAGKMHDNGLACELVQGEAGHLPFIDECFDAVFHHGGIAEFGDRGAAIAEMYRVVRPGRRVVVCDVGVPTDRKLSLKNRLLLRWFAPEYNKPPPVDAVPPSAEGTRLSWYFKGSWYMLSFSKQEWVGARTSRDPACGN